MKALDSMWLYASLCVSVSVYLVPQITWKLCDCDNFGVYYINVLYLIFMTHV